MKNFKADLKVVLDAIEEVLPGISRDFYEIEKLQISKKGVADFVTNADLRTEKTLVSLLQKARPKYSFLTEESGEVQSIDKEDENVKYKWIIDPIDGTFNFMHGIPFFCISIALVKIEKNKTSVVLGVVCNPSNKEIFWAAENMGAYLIDYIGTQRKIRVTKHSDFEKMICGTNINDVISYTDTLKYLKYVQKKKANVRIFGASALEMAYLADGRINILVQDKMKVWDYAAGLLLVREAGGVVKDFNEEDFQFAANSGTIAGNVDVVTDIERNSKNV